MKKKCDYCGNYYDDTEKNCPYCCAPNDHIARSSNSQPKTIEELKQWYKDHNLPPEEITRSDIIRLKSSNISKEKSISKELSL